MTKILKVTESNGFVKVYKLFNLESGLKPHTKKCIDLNDLSFKEVCICEDLEKWMTKKD